jgi:hypothetical protein
MAAGSTSAMGDWRGFAVFRVRDLFIRDLV